MVDLIVIGGGVNGTGIARDAAMRGLSVVLLEREDFGVGASGNSSWMVHGGVRYLFSDPGVTKDSCLDSGYIQKIAPHLIFRIPFLMPMPGGMPGGKLVDLGYIYGAESFLGVYDRYQPLKNGKQSTRLSPQEARRMDPGLREDIVGAVTLDEYGIDAYRLCVVNAISAAEHGAEVKTWTEVERILRDEGGRVRGVLAHDRLTGTAEEIEGRVVMNASGAWSPRLAGRSGLTVKMRPGKGVHVVLDRKISNYGVITKAIDGREMFIIPLESSSVIGTTDDDFYSDPGSLQVTHDEVAYLVQGVEHMLPGIRGARVIRTYAGVRPTLYEYGRNESALSRDHVIFDHGDEGAPGMLSMVGG
ncbi:MAG: glycerol-3-phosphate dehydrogenase/oxidase, partial [Myxococcota bacterium]